MEQTEASIKHLSHLTQGLARQLVKKFGPDGLMPPGDAGFWSMELEGRTFGRWMQELWPRHIPKTRPFCVSRRWTI